VSIGGTSSIPKYLRKINVCKLRRFQSTFPVVVRHNITGVRGRFLPAPLEFSRREQNTCTRETKTITERKKEGASERAFAFLVPRVRTSASNSPCIFFLLIVENLIYCYHFLFFYADRCFSCGLSKALYICLAQCELRQVTNLNIVHLHKLSPSIIRIRFL